MESIHTQVPNFGSKKKKTFRLRIKNFGIKLFSGFYWSQIRIFFHSNNILWCGHNATAIEWRVCTGAEIKSNFILMGQS